MWRYAVLFHAWGETSASLVAGRADHHDWLFEEASQVAERATQGATQREGLRTWAAVEPLPLDRAATVAAIELPRHRARYLDYEGPVSGDRGTVTRIEQGRYRVLSDSADCLEVEVVGDRVGRLRIVRDHFGPPSSWRIEFLPQPEADSSIAEAR